MFQSRTHNCNELRITDAGEEVTLCGWYENGRLEKFEKIPSVGVGFEKTWFENGRLKSVEPYVNGKKEGVSKIWYEDGLLKEKGIYKNGKMYELKIWYGNGRLEKQEKFPEGKSSSPFFLLFKKGMCHSIDGFEGDGYVKSWYYENGQLMYEGAYKSSKKVGVWKVYHENGRLAFEGSYKNGEPDGIWKEWGDTYSSTNNPFITQGDFENLSNQQANFSIQGMEPTERTTLYVSRESSVKDVTKEKVITVVYQYTYYEEDQDGKGVSRVNELHVVNIHLKLESGAPEVGTLYAPPTVLPGNNVQLKAPSVNPGLYEPISNGWEIFTNENDAINHRNGKPFINKETPLYWYQDQNVWVAYYTRTYLGKTYSNPVALSVANYHDLGEVLEDKEHHLYVDKARPEQRNSKIYINDEDNGLKQLTNLFNLSLLDEKATSGDLADHELLDEHVRGCADLDIILRTDLKNEEPAWYPIGYGKNQCFSGTLHGDGYTISGLNESLFESLCGDVYNLGVTGSEQQVSLTPVMVMWRTAGSTLQQQPSIMV